jgi:hypothetical protein
MNPAVRLAFCPNTYKPEMVLSESGVEGDWLPYQIGVLGLVHDTVVT